MLIWDMGFSGGLGDMGRPLDIIAQLCKHGICMPHERIWRQQWMDLNYLSSCFRGNTATSPREPGIFMKGQVLLLRASPLRVPGPPLLSCTSRSIAVGERAPCSPPRMHYLPSCTMTRREDTVMEAALLTLP